MSTIGGAGIDLDEFVAAVFESIVQLASALLVFFARKIGASRIVGCENCKRIGESDSLQSCQSAFRE